MQTASALRAGLRAASCRTSFRTASSTIARPANRILSRSYAGRTSPSTSIPDATKTSSGIWSTLALGALSSIAGVVGYHIAATWDKEPAKDTKKEKSQYGSPEDFQKAIVELRSVFPEKSISVDKEDLKFYGSSPYDYHPDSMPSVIVAPTSTEDVVKIVKTAIKYRMPVTAFSGGTSLEGQYRSHSTGGICVDMSNMNEILEIHEADSDLVCQPGVGWMEINETLRRMGIPLFFPIDPGPGATIGGMMATGCSGTNAVRYGTAKAEWFINA